jgi:hypothetical protein
MHMVANMNKISITKFIYVNDDSTGEQNLVEGVPIIEDVNADSNRANAFI